MRSAEAWTSSALHITIYNRAVARQGIAHVLSMSSSTSYSKSTAIPISYHSILSNVPFIELLWISCSFLWHIWSWYIDRFMRFPPWSIYESHCVEISRPSGARSRNGMHAHGGNFGLKLGEQMASYQVTKTRFLVSAFLLFELRHDSGTDICDGYHEESVCDQLNAECE
jgi:hypothetical protein